MSRTAVNGALVEIATTFGASKTFSTVSNANPGVLSFVADPALAAGDPFYVTSSGWENLAGKVLRSLGPSGAGPYLVSAEGFDTTSTSVFPAGAGAGTVEEVTAWAAIGQILGDTFKPSGDEQQYLTFQYLSSNRQQQIPTTRTPGSLAFEVHDDSGDAGQTAVFAAQSATAETPFRIVLTNGKTIYGAGFFSISNIPILEGNNIVRRSVSISFQQLPTTYAS